MVIFPKEQPVIDNLNSYFVDIVRLLEHCQGEIGAGGIYFQSKAREAVLYFDACEWLNGVYHRQGSTLVGQAARKALLADVRNFNFALRVYRIDPEGVYFWANMPHAEPVYSNLSTEFTNLAALIKKLRSESLTGAVDVVFPESREGGMLFFSNGQLVGGSYSWRNGTAPGSQEDLRRLLESTQNQSALFNVSKIPNLQEATATCTEGSTPDPSTETDFTAAEPAATGALDPLGAAETVLQRFEKVVNAQRNIRMEFSTLLKRKFVAKVHQYAFLDPFAGELEYADRRLRYAGDANPAEVARGVTEAAHELAAELKLDAVLAHELKPWRERYRAEIEQFGLTLYTNP
ncbi:MAG: hypothetical protein WBG37_11960 [Desulfobacterales bacterium]